LQSIERRGLSKVGYGRLKQGRFKVVASPGHILVADDEPRIRSFVGRALNAAGHDPIKTVRGEGYQLFAR
jgi:hypothetical protein